MFCELGQGALPLKSCNGSLLRISQEENSWGHNSCSLNNYQYNKAFVIPHVSSSPKQLNWAILFCALMSTGDVHIFCYRVFSQSNMMSRFHVDSKNLGATGLEYNHLQQSSTRLLVNTNREITKIWRGGRKTGCDMPEPQNFTNVFGSFNTKSRHSRVIDFFTINPAHIYKVYNSCYAKE